MTADLCYKQFWDFAITHPEMRGIVTTDVKPANQIIIGLTGHYTEPFWIDKNTIASWALEKLTADGYNPETDVVIDCNIIDIYNDFKNQDSTTAECVTWFTENTKTSTDVDMLIIYFLNHYFVNASKLYFRITILGSLTIYDSILSLGE